MKPNSPLARKILIISYGLLTLVIFFEILAPVVCDTRRAPAALTPPPVGRL
jgi:hypothetical protein